MKKFMLAMILLIILCLVGCGRDVYEPTDPTTVESTLAHQDTINLIEGLVANEPMSLEKAERTLFVLGYENPEIEYVLMMCNIDWQEQCNRVAQIYLDENLPESEVTRRLLHDGFTEVEVITTAEELF